MDGTGCPFLPKPRASVTDDLLHLTTHPLWDLVSQLDVIISRLINRE